MTARPTILIATGNPGKLEEIRDVYRDLDVLWQTLADFPDLPPAVEDADTFAENAVIKATHYSRLTNRWALADDSGLEVDALGGAPGVRSARFAGDLRDDNANNERLIRELSHVDPERRTARFRCALALADGDAILATADGSIEGLIIDDPRGQNGFGYDPHFYVPAHGITTAEMAPKLKNRLSHRGQALAALRPRLEELLRNAIGAA